MKKFTTSLLIVFLSINLSCAQDTQTQPPTCDNLLGTWINELGSLLVIESLDASTGQITGKYFNQGSANGFPLIGWTNDTTVSSADPCASCKGNNKKVISFTVRWGEIGSITSWTGTCSIVNGTPTIKTLWNLARPNTQFDWDHILTGADTFTPKTQ